MKDNSELQYWLRLTNLYLFYCVFVQKISNLSNHFRKKRKNLLSLDPGKRYLLDFEGALEGKGREKTISGLSLMCFSVSEVSESQVEMETFMLIGCCTSLAYDSAFFILTRINRKE